MATRSYKAAEIIELIDVLRASEDIPAPELAGMETLGKLLLRLDALSDAGIALEVQRQFKKH